MFQQYEGFTDVSPALRQATGGYQELRILTKASEPSSCSNPGVSQKRLAPERRIVLQQVVDVPDPIVLLSRTDSF
jgi:hypothetical protein